MNDFSTPRRMSPSALLVIFVKSFKEMLGLSVVGLGYVFARNDSDSPGSLILKIAGIFIGLLVIAVIATIARYFFRKFHIENDKLIFSHSFLARQTTSIPLSRVHTLRTKRGLFYRIAGVRGITFDTLANDSQEVELILDEGDWQMLLGSVSAGENLVSDNNADVSCRSIPDSDIWRISNSDIIQGAFCQNHLKGFIVLSAILFPIIDNINQFAGDYLEQFFDYLDAHAGELLPSGIQWLILFAALYLIVTALWVGKTILQYGEMTIHIDGDRLTMESGLISRITCRLSRDKATVLNIKQNPLEKLAHCQTVILSQAHNASGKREDGNVRIYGSMRGGELLHWWLQDSGGRSNDTVIEARSGAGLFARRFVPHLLIAVAAAFVIIHFSQNWLMTVIICAIYLAGAAIRAFMAWNHSGIRLTGSYVRIDCGNIARIRKYIKFRDVEAVGIRCTPFTRYTGRVALCISANSGAATVYSLDIDSAIRIRAMMLDRHI